MLEAQSKQAAFVKRLSAVLMGASIPLPRSAKARARRRAPLQRCTRGFLIYPWCICLCLPESQRGSGTCACPATGAHHWQRATRRTQADLGDTKTRLGAWKPNAAMEQPAQVAQSLHVLVRACQHPHTQPLHTLMVLLAERAPCLGPMCCVALTCCARRSTSAR